MKEEAFANSAEVRQLEVPRERPEALWQVELLGPMRLVFQGQVQTALGTQKSSLLLAWLALHPGPNPRERILDRLWPDMELSAARNNLSTVLVSLRRLLEPPGVARGSVLITSATEIGLDTERVTTDFALFESLLKQAARAGEERLRADLLARATALYRGDILPGSDQDWVIRESERLRARVEEALAALATAREALGDLTGALEAVQQALALDPYSEALHCRRIRLYVLTGRVGLARDANERFARLIRKEFGAAPSPATERLVAQLLAHRPDPQGALSLPQAVAPLAPLAHDAPASPALETPSPTQEGAERDRTPVGGPSPVPARLPVVLSRFFGREKELAHLARLLMPHKSSPPGGMEPQRASRLVTLVGPGGIGKTRLALEFARQLSARMLSWCGFVSLAELTSAEQIAAQIADALALRPTVDRPLLPQILAFLQEQDRPQAPPLLVLDNLEHLLGEESDTLDLPPLADLVQTLLERVPGLMVLCTSRRRLGLRGEQIVPVEPFPIPQQPVGFAEGEISAELHSNPSVRLYLDRARSVRPDFSLTPTNATAVAALCRQLEGSPLALELAAAWVRALPPRKMWERLTQGSDIPAGSYSDLPARHRTLSAALDWSYRLLTPDQQRLFRRLSVFQGGWTAEEAAAICAAETPQRGQAGTEDLLLLVQLQEASLIRSEASDEGEVRYGFLESVHAFSRNRLEEQDDPEALQRRHALYFLDLSEAFSKAGEESIRAALLVRLEDEQENLRVALRWLLQQPEYAEEALRMPAALMHYWEMRGYARVGLEHLQAALALPEGQSPLPVRALALNAAGAQAMRLADYPLACSLQQQALALWEQLGHVRGQAGSLHNLANVLLKQGEFAEAHALYQRALTLNQEAGNLPWQALNLNGLAEAMAKRGRYEEAIASFDISLHLARQAGDGYGEGVALTNLARVCLQAGEIGKSEECAHLALEQAQRSGNRSIEPYLHFCLGEIARRRGDLPTAETWLRRAIGAAQQQSDRQEMVTGLKSLAAVRTAQGQAAQAARLHGSIARISSEIQATPEPAERKEYARQLADAQALLSADAFDTYRAEGERMTWEELDTGN